MRAARVRPSALKWRSKVRGWGDQPWAARSTSAMWAPLRWGSSFLSLTASSSASGRRAGLDPARPGAQGGKAALAIGPHPAVERGARHLHHLTTRPGVGLAGESAHEVAPLSLGELRVGGRACQAVTEKGYVFGAVCQFASFCNMGKPCK